jgi:hypothetical protein
VDTITSKFQILERPTMKITRGEPAGKKTLSVISRETLSRRKLLAGSVAAGAMLVSRGQPATAADGKKTFTILHTNDLHSNFMVRQ